MRAKNFMAIVIANFFLISVVAENNKIDSVLTLLKSSIEKNGMVFDGTFSDFKKVERVNETLCYLYPEFMYVCQNGDNPFSRTRITIHLVKNEFLRKDTFFYQGVRKEERFAILTNKKKLLKKNEIFVEIETPVGSNNAYYQTDRVEEAVNWMSKILCNNNKKGQLNKKDQFYDTDMEVYMGVHLFFKGIYHSKK